MRNSILRIAVMFAWIPIAFLVGSLAHSVDAFIAVMGIGLAVTIVLRVVLR